MDDSKQMWVVIVEADGNKLPRMYYRRLAALAYTVRGDMEQGPMARRSGEEDRGVIFQEGCIICPAESTARTIANLAITMLDEIADLQGAPAVSIGRLELDTNFTRTKEDSQVLDRIERVLGRRGRRPPNEPWVVSCLECGKATEMEHWSPVNCPNCGGFLIHNRRGRIISYRDPGGDLLTAWRRLRFAGAHWEPAPIKSDGRVPLANPELSGKERQTADSLQNSPALARLAQMPRDVGFAFLDAMFVNRAYIGVEKRLNGRIQAATAYFQRNGSPTAVSLPERDAPDLLDAAAVMGGEAVAEWLLATDK